MTPVQTFTPELLPRRGEINAWALSAAGAFGLYLLSLRQTLPGWAWVFVGLLVFSALSISLGNWMDRKTFICLEADGVVFENGLRKTRLAWDAIRAVQSAPARWGLSVQVLGERQHFSFSTLGEMTFQGQTRGRTGFAQGQLIMDEIIRSAGLTCQTRREQFLTYTRA